MAHTSKLRVDYHPFSTVNWCLLQKGYHCVCLSASDTGRRQIVGSIYSKTCVKRPPLGPCFTAGIDSGPVYSVSTL
jgi:hypothetical protein